MEKSPPKISVEEAEKIQANKVLHTGMDAINRYRIQEYQNLHGEMKLRNEYQMK